MHLIPFNKRNTLGIYNDISGKIDDFIERNFENLNTHPIVRGFCNETPEGWATVYGKDDELYFQINSKKWNLTDKNTKYSYLRASVASFKIKDENASFEISYNHWTNDALMSDMDDDDVDHDFFAYVIWLCQPEKAKRMAKRWSSHNKEDI